MIGRLIYYSVLLAMVVAVVGTQLDRQVQTNPRYLALAPPPFRAAAQRLLVETLMAGGEDAASVVEARKLVRMRPVPAHHLALFALSAQFDGEEARALPALEESARRGWREPIAQLAVAQASILVSDYPSAAQRVAALVATGSMPRETDAMLATLVAEDGGREAIVTMMGQPGYWQTMLLRRLTSAAAPEDAVATLALARASGIALDCPHYSRFLAQQTPQFTSANAATIAAIGC